MSQQLTPLYSPQRQRMLEDMAMRGLREETQRDYIHFVRSFAAFVGRPPDAATAEDLRRFQVHGGISIRSPNLDGKRFEILLELIPGARGVDALAGSDTANAQHFQPLREAAGARGVQLVVRTVNAYGEIAPAIAAAKASGAAGLNVLDSGLLFGSRQVIIERTAALGLPAIYQWPENAREGGLIGHGPSLVRIYREQMSRLTVKILRGAQPADLPVEQPDKFELVINLKTAKTLGLSVPQRSLPRPTTSSNDAIAGTAPMNFGHESDTNSRRAALSHRVFCEA
jgi:hypothetical protein